MSKYQWIKTRKYEIIDSDDRVYETLEEAEKAGHPERPIGPRKRDTGKWAIEWIREDIHYS